MHSNTQRGSRMREERNRLGLSQQRIADAAGIRREMWAKYESGAEPGANVLAAIANIGVDVLYVITGQRGTQQGNTSLKPDEAALLDNYRASPPDQQRLLSATSAAFAQRPKKKSA